MRKTILKWLLLTVLVAYAASAVIWARAEAQKRVCKGIVVNVAKVAAAGPVTAQSVRTELAKYPRPLKGAPVASIDTRSLESFLGSYSNFEEVDCSVGASGILTVDIVPMIPEIRVFDADGSSYYINKDGKRIDSKANFFVDVPVVAGSFGDTFPPGRILGVTRFIQSDPFLSNLVGMVEVKDADNIILVPRVHGHVINFGDTMRLAEKRAAVLAVYRKVMPWKGWEEYDTISVKYKGQVVASRRDKTRQVHSGGYEEEEDPEEATLPDAVELEMVTAQIQAP